MSDTRDPGDAWVTAADGNSYWGRFGAAGLLLHDPGRGVLLQHRADWSHHGGTWGIPGGARHEHEDAVAAAVRESNEEAGVPLDGVLPRYRHVLDRGGWTYATIVADAARPFEPVIADAESHALEWVPLDRVEEYSLHPGFAASWPLLRPLLTAPPAIVVDAANVIGSVPDGWWKDRRAAAVRLRDRILALGGAPVAPGLVGLSDAALPGIDAAYPEWVVVTEGVARDVESAGDVRVVGAPELGDDTIVAEARALVERGLRVSVVTADEELRTRVEAVGVAATRGPKKLLKRLPI
ncbi:NTP pyrophosphohydrolase [Leucobacter sp. OLJS4]|uniref:NUDIX domain-containing protein n=1 Tax=unclassified Leucobacter TaxID=2621730 RepID=UPI000C1874CD|nr:MULTISPECIES: NUDIX hydrolase [unclassified Leucobacter]PIJ31524.1 NTP pyrophosphohydrolase [Leucobacter sp. OLES1]PII83012.1 NTP pyrophosphohydrolase [Leucobacter sp. OLCALW19]PII91676.1 NTP pyrophosphohydrolase [Leucobacter sp. OLTLW20]PII91738.1 NTP pyrophosphohydrolase [Leucobacter sp. OLAS13]PII97601.1 NTP pyrophosphohydrolase [Leucobacter sp. OLCS4]